MGKQLGCPFGAADGPLRTDRRRAAVAGRARRAVSPLKTQGGTSYEPQVDVRERKRALVGTRDGGRVVSRSS